MHIKFTKDRDVIDTTPFVEVRSPAHFTPDERPGISKYRAPLGCDTFLESLFVNQNSDTLIVSCHGALPRRTTSLPRFERLRTFLNTSFSSIYFGDPTLYLSDQLSLAWYTGWAETDVHKILADWVITAAKVSGASKILFLGSSGGGFASLQISSLVPGSLAVPLNPQTEIWRYQPEGSLGYARNYVKYVMPHLMPSGGIRELTSDLNWSLPLGERASAILRYESKVENRVLYAQNLNDVAHVQDHYEPFRKVIELSPNAQQIRFFTYAGQHRHTSPPSDVFSQILSTALEWAEEGRCAADTA